MFTLLPWWGKWMSMKMRLFTFHTLLIFTFTFLQNQLWNISSKAPCHITAVLIIICLEQNWESCCLLSIHKEALWLMCFDQFLFLSDRTPTKLNTVSWKSSYFCLWITFLREYSVYILSCIHAGAQTIIIHNVPKEHWSVWKCMVDGWGHPAPPE